MILGVKGDYFPYKLTIDICYQGEMCSLYSRKRTFVYHLDVLHGSRDKRAPLFSEADS
jgi:hypothetical protein